QAAGVRHLVVEVTHAGRAIGADWDRGPFAIHRLGPSNLGLALPLARRLAEVHGGTVTIETLGDGARLQGRFTLQIPAGPRKERLAILRPKSSAARPQPSGATAMPAASTATPAASTPAADATETTPIPVSTGEPVGDRSDGEGGGNTPPPA